MNIRIAASLAASLLCLPASGNAWETPSDATPSSPAGILSSADASMHESYALSSQVKMDVHCPYSVANGKIVPDPRLRSMVIHPAGNDGPFMQYQRVDNTGVLVVPGRDRPGSLVYELVGLPRDMDMANLGRVYVIGTKDCLTNPDSGAISDCKPLQPPFPPHVIASQMLIADGLCDTIFNRIGSWVRPDSYDPDTTRKNLQLWRKNIDRMSRPSNMQPQP